MPQTSTLKCENCETGLGKLEDAYVWLDRPVCKSCFTKLSGSRIAAKRTLWMPLAIAFALLSVALSILLVLHKPAADSADSHVSIAASVPTISGPSRSDVLDMLRANRTWYWHWEDRTKDHPFKYVVDKSGRISNNNEPQIADSLELRWVLVHQGHLLIPIDPQTFEGFQIASGRQVDTFSDEKLKE